MKVEDTHHTEVRRSVSLSASITIGDSFPFKTLRTSMPCSGSRVGVQGVRLVISVQGSGSGFGVWGSGRDRALVNNTLDGFEAPLCKSKHAGSSMQAACKQWPGQCWRRRCAHACAHAVSRAVFGSAPHEALASGRFSVFVQ